MAKTAEEVREDLKTSIAYENPKIDLSSGTVARDIGVDAFSAELAGLYTEQERVRNLYLLDSTAFTYEEANDLAASYGVYRLSATRATGYVIFGTTTKPTAGNSVIIPAGTTVTTSGESTGTKSYVTLSDAAIDSSIAINPNTNYYEKAVLVQATAPGTSSNVAPGVINQLKSTIAGVSVVYNRDSIVNGTDEETTADLIDRVKLRLRGTVFGTADSYLAKVYEDARVLDAKVVDPDSEFSVRGPGTVDIYILGSETMEFSQREVPSGTTVALTKVPYVSGTAKVVLPNGTTYYEGDVFNIYKDETSIYSASSKSKDKLVWSEQFYNSTIANLASYTIVYSYNSLINSLQDTFNTDQYRIITSDVLVRNTSQLDAAMDFDIVTLPGYDTSTVKKQVIYSIQSFVNTFKLDQTLRQSDIIGLVENTPGVDYVKLPMRQFNLKGKEGVEDVESSPLEYIRISDEDINIG